MFNKLCCMLMAAAAALALLAGCTGGESPEKETDSVVVVLPATSEPEAGFDPVYGWGVSGHVHEPLIQSTLTVTTTGLEIAYDLATDIEVSEDGLTWTVKIRSDARFTDGKPLTAADVAFTYNTVKENSTVNDFTMFDRAVASDGGTVVFHMASPCSVWPYTMACVGIVPEHAYGPGYGENPLGSGRYILKQWDKGQQVILEANPGYYGEAPAIKKVTILFMSEDAAFVAVQAGQADLAYTAATYADQAVREYQLLSFATVDNRGINLPALAPDGTRGNAVTSDPAVRRAINIGIDRELMIRDVLGGHGAPAYSVCDGMPWSSDASVVEYDFDAAAALLEESGWAAGADGVRARDGIRAQLNILYPIGDSVRQALAAQTAGQLLKLGFDVSFEGVGWDTAYDRAQQECLIWGWGAHSPMELYNIYHTAPGSDAAKYSPYANAAVDAYMDEALRSVTEDSYALWQKAQWDGVTGIAADIPWVWLVNIDHLYWARTGLQVAEQKPHPHGHGWSILNNVDRWSWEA